MPSLRFEITNKCNLKCPSCIEGRLNQANRHEAFEYADVELCRSIFRHLSSFDNEYSVYLYLFCEPCLHPQLDEILSLMDEYGLNAYISSNLNVKQDWDALLRHTALKRLTISVSGIRQEIYELGHCGGRIDIVRKNLEEISRISPKYNTEILVFFHQYNDNEEDEAEFRALCQTYGFTFVPSPAYFMYSPWAAEKHFSGEHDAVLQYGVENTLPRLLVEKNLFMQHMNMLSKVPCSFELAYDVSLDCRGNVHQGCCMEPFTLDSHAGAFLQMSEQEINDIYRNYPLCHDCKSKGYHVQFSLIPHVEYTRLAKRRCLDTNEQPLNTVLRGFIRRTKPLNFLKNTPIHVYGTVGNSGIITLLRAQGYRLGDCIDDNLALQGTAYCSQSIRPLSEFSEAELCSACIIICFIREKAAIDALKDQLKAKGVRHVYALHEFFFLHDVQSG